MSITITSLLKPVDINEVTKNVIKDDVEHTVTGEGIFDIMMDTATKHLKAQFEGNRIREEDYAAAYVELYKATLQFVAQVWLQRPLTEMQAESEAAKSALYKRQIEGFNEDFKHKILKIMMDSYGIGFSVAKDNFVGTIPAPMTATAITDFFNNFIINEFDKSNAMTGESGSTT